MVVTHSPYPEKEYKLKILGKKGLEKLNGPWGPVLEEEVTF
jgi:hypothetical protein